MMNFWDERLVSDTLLPVLRKDFMFDLAVVSQGVLSR